MGGCARCAAVEALGIDRGLARAAVAEVFGEVDEDALIAAGARPQVAPRRSARGEAAVRETRSPLYLLAQGFDAGRVNAAIRSRVKNASHDD